MKTVVGLFFLPSHQNIFEETKLRENRSHKSFFNLKIFLGILCGGLSLLTSLPVSAAGVTLQLPSDYKSTHIISLGNASAFTFDFSIKGSAVSGENSFIFKRPRFHLRLQHLQSLRQAILPRPQHQLRRLQLLPSLPMPV